MSLDLSYCRRTRNGGTWLARWEVWLTEAEAGGLLACTGNEVQVVTAPKKNVGTVMREAREGSESAVGERLGV